MVLARYGEIVELDDEGRCCGAGGAYSALQPELAGQIRTQKLAVIAGRRPGRGGQRQPGLRPVAGRRRRAGPPSHGDRRPAAGPVATGGLERRWPVSSRTSAAGSRQISEELADLAIERLRESIDAGGVELPVDERRLTRARRAVERAAAILAEPDDRDANRLRAVPTPR